MSDDPATTPAVATAAAADGCCATPGCAAPPVRRDAGWHTAAKTARLLSWLSLVWMTGEGALGLLAGTTSGSIALCGWALGSAVEGLASVIVIWRFTGARTVSETAERRAQRAVAVSFFLLAPYITIESVRNLVTGHEAARSMLGMVLTAASVVVMPALGVAKQRLARRLDSGATAGEGVQNLLCAGQAAAVLIGLALTTALDWRWVDPVIGLGLAAVALHEGRAAWRGEDCC